MTMTQFIQAHRQELEEYINRVLNHVPATASCNCPLSRTDHMHRSEKGLSVSDVREWVLNDEGLYRWARAEGVKI